MSSNQDANDMNHLYHERQSLSLCGVHAVNNLLQTDQYTKSDFDQVCLALSPSRLWNPHRSMLGIGNYDVNVVMILLQQAGLSVKWHDQRKGIDRSCFENKNKNDNLIGILWNVASDSFLNRWVLRGRRHWIALLHHHPGMDGQSSTSTWVNLDSLLATPEMVGSNTTSTHEDVIRLLQSKKDTHVLFIYKEDPPSGN